MTRPTHRAPRVPARPSLDAPVPAMPLRNERQAYWDDIENNIARVQPLSASRALDRVCPDAAAERLALKSRLRDVEEETRQVHRLRARAAAEANVLSRETDAMLNLEAKERAFEEAQRFVRGRLQNDRPDGQRLGMRPPERLSRAAVGAPKEDRLRAAAPFAVRAPAAHAHAHRERNERWGSGEVSPLMGGGYTVVMERAHRDLEDAVHRRERAERERKLYFMESGTRRRGEDEDTFGRGDDTFDGTASVIDTMNRTSAAMALRGWEPAGPAGRGRGRTRDDDDDDDDDDAASVLPPPRGSDSRAPLAVSTETVPGIDRGIDRGTDRGTRVSSIASIGMPTSVGASISHARGKRDSVSDRSANTTGSGYGAQMALIGGASGRAGSASFR